MKNLEIEIEANDLVKAVKVKSVPVDVFDIARREGIKLCKCKPLKNFFGRIECFYLSKKSPTFFLYYPDIDRHGYPPKFDFQWGMNLVIII